MSEDDKDRLLRVVASRLRYLAANVDPKELYHEINALARDIENEMERDVSKNED